MTIRSYQPGDEAAQVAIYNEAAAEMPKFKPVTLDELRRRARAPEFDPGTRSYALDKGRPVGYATFHRNGRVSYPWCLKGHEKHGESLFESVLQGMRQRGLKTAFAAYRADWPAQRDFFLGHGFRPAREMINYVLDLVEMPTQRGKHPTLLSPGQPADVPAILGLFPPALRVATAEDLDRHLFHNPHFAPDSVYVIRSRGEGKLLAVGVLVEDPAYADPKQVDAAMPCFRLGAFGSEGMQTKRINGLFSFLVPDGPDFMPLALQLMEHAAYRLELTPAVTLAAQVASDVPHLVRFYKHHFRRQGSFPVFERSLDPA
jgi:hypothetical protein